MEWKRQLEERAIPTAVAMLTSGYPGPRTAHLQVNCHDGIVMTGPGIHFLEVEGSSQSSGEQHPAVIPVKSIPPELLEQLPRDGILLPGKHLMILGVVSAIHILRLDPFFSGRHC